MKVAIMQPYFFPYIGQFNLILAADRFLLCDEVQYIKKGWINRNRIITQLNTVDYITVPIQKHSSKEIIKNIYIANELLWQKEILNRLKAYTKAPYYKEVSELVEFVVYSKKETIAELNAICFETVCKYLDIPFKIEFTSSLNIDYSAVTRVEDWAITISKAVNATEYLNPPGGMSIYEKEYFKNAGIELKYIKPITQIYKQFSNTFEANLSIIDVLMFNGSKGSKEMISKYEVI